MLASPLSRRSLPQGTRMPGTGCCSVAPATAGTAPSWCQHDDQSTDCPLATTPLTYSS
jgi:hypothetical protein